MKFIIESATDEGRNTRFLCCAHAPQWVHSRADATRFHTLAEAEQLDSDWTDFFAMKGFNRLCNITEVNPND